MENRNKEDIQISKVPEIWPTEKQQSQHSSELLKLIQQDLTDKA